MRKQDPQSMDERRRVRTCRWGVYQYGDLEYAFIKAIEQVDSIRSYQRNNPDRTVLGMSPDDEPSKDKLSEAFDTVNWKARLEASGRVRSAMERSIHRTRQARVRQTQGEAARSTSTASSGSWLNSPWVWLLGAYWLGQHNQKMWQQQQRNQPDFSKYPYTMDGRTWNPYKRRYERR